MEPKTDTLAREYVDFLLELSVALHRHTMYPGDHPSIGPAVDSVAQRAEGLVRDRPTLAIGVARHRLLVEDAATDPDHPVLRRLADALHRHQIGAVSILKGVRGPEIGLVLRELARDPDADRPLGFQPELAARCPHIKLHPMAFDTLTIVDEGSAEEGRPGSDSSRAADLWAALARTALLVEADRELLAEQLLPEEIARAIGRHPPSVEYNRELLGHLTQLVRDLASGRGEGHAELRDRVSGLVAALPGESLRRLVSSDAGQRAGLMYAAINGMGVSAVLEIVKAAAGSETQTISHGLLRMLTKLAAHTQSGSEHGRVHAEREFKEQIVRLLEDWNLDDPNPGGYTRVLEQLSAAAQSSDLTLLAATPDTPPTPLRVVQMSLESGSFEPLTEKAIEQLLQTGQVSELFSLLGSPPSGAGGVHGQIVSRLTSPEALALIIGQEQVDIAGLEALIPQLPFESYGPLLDAIGASPNRSVRRRLLDRLSETRVDIAPLIAERLQDTRWFVQRNMLMLLARTGRVPEGFSATHWTKHADVRVRAEAIRLQLTLPNERTAAIRAALNDESARTVHLGLAAAQDGCPRELVGRVVEIASDASSDQDIRTIAVNTLGRIGGETALDALLRIADGGRSWLGRPRLPPKTPVLMAVLRVLGERWAADARGSSILALAGRSSDPDVRRAASPERR